MRGVVLAMMTVFATNTATNISQYVWSAVQTATLADWWARYNQGVVEKETALHAKLETFSGAAQR